MIFDLIRQQKNALLRMVTPNPWDTPEMEFRWGLWRGVSAMFTQAGRQLGEDSTRPLMYRRTIPAETVACKYAGSRAGKEINVTALRTVMENFDQVLAQIKLVRDYHLKQVGKSEVDIPGIWDLYIIALASVAMIAFRARDQKAQLAIFPVPDHLASQYQIVSGIFMICREMISNSFPDIRANEPIRASDMYDYADRHKIFTSPNGMVCAGSPARIMELLEMCHDGGLPERNTSSLEATNKKVTLDALVGDVPRWYAYALMAIELDLYLELAILHQRHEHYPEVEIRTGLRDYCAQLLGDVVPISFEDVRAQSVRRQAAILKILSRPPVTALSDKIMVERLGFDGRY